MDYQLIRSKRKTLSLQINNNAELIVRAPNRLSVIKIEQFIDEKSNWIEKKSKSISLKKPQKPNYTEGEKFLYLGSEYPLSVNTVPAKVGREQLSIILYDAYDALKPGGKITFVTINGLRHFIKDNFKSVFGNYKKLKQGQKYTIAQAIKS